MFSEVLKGKSAPSSMSFEVSWDTLEPLVLNSNVGQALTDQKELRKQGAGLPSPDADYRLFGARKEDVRVVFYKDAASWCPYCQKVWIMLEEKKIPYKMTKVNMRSYGDKPPDFLRKVPNGLLPAVEIDGVLQTESIDIMMNLERLFSADDGSNRMWPIDETELARARNLMRLERTLFSLWCNLIFRPNFGSMRGPFEEGMDAVDNALSETDSPWFLDRLSIVDLQYITHVERMAASVPYWAGFKIRGDGRWPAVEKWMDAFEDLTSYLATKSDYYTHIKDIPPQYGPGYMVREAEIMAATIDGSDGSWSLPLPALSSGDIEPIHEKLNPGDEAARFEAAYKLVTNRNAVIKFALRGAGSPGRKRFQAPLADPYAEPALEYMEQMDAVLRNVVYRLIHSTSASSKSDIPSLEGGDSDTKQALTDCCDYLKARIGVPRDMTYPAARQLRAYLNDIKTLLQ